MRNAGALTQALRTQAHMRSAGALTIDQLEPIDKGNYLLSPNARETQATPANGLPEGTPASHLTPCSGQRRPGTKAGAARVCAHVTRGRHRYAPGISTPDRTRLSVVSYCRKDRRTIGHTTARDTAASMTAHRWPHQPLPVPAQRPGTHARTLSSPLAHSTALLAFLRAPCLPRPLSSIARIRSKYSTLVGYLVQPGAMSRHPVFFCAITYSACGGPSL